MNMKTILCVVTSALATMLVASDTPEVSNVVMSQAATGRKVTITYDLGNAPDGAVVTLDIETNKTGTATNVDSDWVSIGGAAVCNAQGDVWTKVSQGSHTITWRPDLSWEGHKVALANGGARAVVTAWTLDNTPDYMVVDISAAAQQNTQKYYPSVDFIPGGLLGRPEYRTTAIVMRKIMAKDVTWTMGSTTLETARNTASEATHPVTLTNNYYIGVFEVTQAQWELIQPNRTAPSYFNNAADRAMRPVEQVCYNEIRNNSGTSTGGDSTYNWPADPNPSSFLGRLRTKTGIDFELPSDAQWEFAARAGNGDTKWGDGSGITNADEDENLQRVARCRMTGGWVGGTSEPDQSCGATNGTAIVGSYAPNSWGIYDMHGNVWEWCLDWFADNISGLNGAVNTASTGTRVNRGGTYGNVAGSCRPARRRGNYPQSRGNDLGVRLACTAGLR